MRKVTNTLETKISFGDCLGVFYPFEHLPFCYRPLLPLVLPPSVQVKTSFLLVSCRHLTFSGDAFVTRQEHG